MHALLILVFCFHVCILLENLSSVEKIVNGTKENAHTTQEHKHVERHAPTYSINRSLMIRTVHLCHEETNSFCHHTEEADASEMDRLKSERFPLPLRVYAFSMSLSVYISQSHLEGYCLLLGLDIFKLTQTHLLL